MKKILSLLIVILALASVPVPIQAAAPKLSKTKITLTVGKSKQLTLKNVAKTVKVKWKTTDKKIATVKNGLVKAKKAGTCKVTATANKKTYTCKVTVKKASSTTKTKASTEQTATTQNVWKTKSGKKYHSNNHCGTTDTSKATLITLEEALRLGLEKCSKCWE